MIKLLDLLKEDSPFVPKGSRQEREQDYNRVLQNKIQEYIKNGMKGNLNFPETPITSLPDNLTKVGGDLYLFSTKITSLPNNLIVEGNLDLTNAPITTLPSNLTVEGDLTLYNTKITSLPNNLKVGGELYLQYTPLSEKSPKNKIGAFFYEKKIRAMVKDLEGKNFKGYINM